MSPTLAPDLPANPRSPRIEPATAVAIALLTVFRRPFDVEGPTVKLIMAAIDKCGWKFVPKD